MSISFIEAYARLNTPDYQTVNALIGLVNEVSGEVKGAPVNSTYILYSGVVPDSGVKATTISSKIKGQSSGKILDIVNSEVGRLVNNPEFRKALSKIITKDVLEVTDDISLATTEQKNEILEKFRKIYEGKNADGTTRLEGTSSIWDIASKKFVEEVDGDFRLVLPNKPIDVSVFIESELPALLLKENITVEGIPISTLKDLMDDPAKGIEAVKKLLSTASYYNLIASGLDAIDPSSGIPEANLNTWLENAESYHNNGYPAEVAKKIYDTINALDPSLKTYYQEGIDIAKDIGGSAGWKNGLRALGPAFLVLNTFFVAEEAEAAIDMGDTVGARDIWENWVAESMGGFAGAEIGAVVGTVVASVALGIAGVAAAPVVIAFSIGGAVAGGYFGASSAGAYYKDFIGKTDAETRDLIHGVSEWILGDAYTTDDILSKIPAEGEPQLEYISLSPEYDTSGEINPAPTISPEVFSYYVNDLIAGAKSDIAFRHGLKELSPFVILNADLDQHNTNGELDLYNSETNTGTMTEEWIEARSLALLFRNIQNDGVDINGLTDDSYSIVIHHENGDLEIISVTGTLGAEPKGIYFGNEMNETFAGGAGDDLLFGEGGADTFDGMDGHDKIYGGEGDDHLTGGKGVDYLEGGAGDDTYYFKAENDLDIVRDKQGNNKLVINGKTITTITQVATDTNVYKDDLEDQDNTYVLTDSGEMIITVSDGTQSGTITIDWFDKDTNNFGLNLGDYKVPTLPSATTVNLSTEEETSSEYYTLYDDAEDVTNQIINNDLVTTNAIVVTASNGDTIINGSDSRDILNGDVGMHGISGLLVDNASIIESESYDPAHFGNDTLYGNGGNDTLRGFSGNDNLFGGEGEDRLEGDRGEDTLDGGVGEDLLYGGAHNDILLGGEGNDKLWGDAYYSTRYDEHGNYIIRNFDRTTEFGNDILDGGLGDDQLSGGAGDDVLIGGQGDDILAGDVSASQDEGGLNSDGSYTPYYPTDAAQHGNDILFGGSGNDTLSGGGGDDILNGGDDDDSLYGDNIRDGYGPLDASLHGNDTLNGGKGIDWLYGGGGDDLLNGGDNTDYLFGDINMSTDTSLAIADHGNDVLEGGAGDDFLFGGGGNDHLYGGVGIDEISGEQGNDVILGGNDNDRLWGNEGDDTISGDAGVDLLQGGDGNDQLFGGAGEDTLYGENHSDSLTGGAGNDHLYGGSGDDTYTFNLGDGYDVFNDAQGENIIKFGAGISVENIQFEFQSLLTFIDYGSADTIRIEGASVATIEFADGTTLRQSDWQLVSVDLEGTDGNDDLLGRGGSDSLNGGLGIDRLWGAGGDDTLLGGEGNDKLWGGNDNDTLIGGSENDSMWGGNDNDTLIGGSGNDSLSGDAGDDHLEGGLGTDLLGGGAGSDTYTFNLGDGADTITDIIQGNDINTLSFGEGILLSDLVFQNSTDDYLTIRNSTNSDSIKLNNYFANNGAGRMVIRFADESTLSYGAVLEQVFSSTDDADYIYGTSDADSISTKGGNDHIYAGAGNDIIEGGTGRDELLGGEGGDTYIFNLGDGVDYIDDSYLNSGVNTVLFGEGIQFSDLVFRKDGSNYLNITNSNSEDVVIIKSYFSAANGGHFIIEFADGVMLTHDDIIDAILQGTDNDDTILGTTGDDVIDGGAGSDQLVGSKGNDELNGGEGDDYLSGGEGDDVYLFGAGSGHDTINTVNPDGFDKVLLTGNILSSDIELDRIYGMNSSKDDLRLVVISSGDELLVKGFFERSSQFTDATGAIDEIEFSNGEIWDQEEIQLNLTNGPTSGDDYLVGTVGVDNLLGMGGNDYLIGSGDGDHLIGGSGDDRLEGGDGNDSLEGGNGRDSLEGWHGDDTLDGGAGDDKLYGGYGNDTYIFAKGYGKDWVSDGEKSGTPDYNLLKINSDVMPEDIEFRRYGYNLVLTFKDNIDDVLIVRGHYKYDEYRLDGIEFFNGSVVTSFESKGVYIESGVGDIRDYSGYYDGRDDERGNAWKYRYDGGYGVSGTYNSDILIGQKLRDILTGYEGDDTLIGGGGDDDLKGDEGNDLLQGGQGNDRLYGGDGDDTLLGGAGTDKIRADAGADILSGGSGNDTLIGGDGSDTYLLNLGGGTDTVEEGSIDDSSDISIIKIEEGITPSEVSLYRNGDYLMISLNGRDQVAVRDYFNSDYILPPIEIQFSDGVIWNGQQVDSKLQPLLQAYDGLSPALGYLAENSVSSDGTLWGAGEANFLEGATDGNAVLYGERGDDILVGHGFNNVLDGGEGNDLLLGSGELYGEAGNDKLYGGIGDDLLSGGTGVDKLTGGQGNDRFEDSQGDTQYYYSYSSDGHDSISDLGGVDEIVFDATLHPDDVVITQNEMNLVIAFNENSSVTIDGWFSGTTNKIESFHFEGLSEGADITLSADEITARVSNPGYVPPLSLTGTNKANTLDGAEGDDYLNGKGGADTLNGYAGADTIIGGGGNDQLYGGSENDTIKGSNGADHLYGGTGKDVLVGGKGDDTYHFTNGDGFDKINNASKAFATETDVLSLDGGISEEDIWFKKTNNHLDIYLLGSDDKVRVKNWYKAEKYHIDEIDAGTSSINTGGIEQLVNAMAAFGAPSGGAISLTEEEQQQVSSAIASAWQSA